MPVLTGVDLLRIQEYVFASNRLRDVLAASYAIEGATDSERGLRLPKESLILASGGNALMVFATWEQAREWTLRFTRRLDEELAPGLEAAVAHRAFEPGQLARAWLVLQADLARNKLERAPSAPQLGLSVTASCALTGLPAIGEDEGGELISRRIETLRTGLEKSKSRWRPFLPAHLENAPGWHAEFPNDLDKLGRSERETSLVGVVHLDGNRVGELIIRWLRRKLDAPDEQVTKEAQEWSCALQRLGEHVLKALVRRIAVCVTERRESPDWRARPYLTGQPQELTFPLCFEEKAERVFLPLRPIVLGGDDLTFVCDGRIALDLAATGLREFESIAVAHLGDNGSPAKLTASAGVAVVRSHAPFYRSYEAAKKLCDSAKQGGRTGAGDARAEAGGWMDWMIGVMWPLESVSKAREALQADGRRLTMRPYPVTGASGRQSWSWLDEELLGPGPASCREQGFRGAPAWRHSRNRVKQLEGLVRSGPDDVRRQMALWRATQAKLELPGSLPEGGFLGSATPLLDAIEIMDLHLRLEREAGGKEECG